MSFFVLRESLKYGDRDVGSVSYTWKRKCVNSLNLCCENLINKAFITVHLCKIINLAVGTLKAISVCTLLLCCIFQFFAFLSNNFVSEIEGWFMNVDEVSKPPCWGSCSPLFLIQRSHFACGIFGKESVLENCLSLYLLNRTGTK